MSQKEVNAFLDKLDAVAQKDFNACTIAEFGKRIIEVLDLEENKNGSVKTAYGNKFPLGLGRIILNTFTKVGRGL